MRQVIATVLAIGGLLVAAGCQKQVRTTDDDLNIITLPQLEQMRANTNRKTAIVDVRAATVFMEGHIPGAINIPRLGVRRGDERLAEAKQIVVYGTGDPQDLVPAVAAKRMIEAGYKNVYLFREGIEAWEAADKPLEEGL